MVLEGWQLAYQTPVGGYPWSIPFEFPIYQSLVALISKTGGFPLDPVGRLVSFSFLIGCAWPVYQIARRLKLTREVVWVFCALLWSSPYYLFWSRTFTIEIAALFFILAAIPYGLNLQETAPRPQSALLFAVWGTLGMLQKVTTAAPVIMFMGIYLVGAQLKRTRLSHLTARKIACWALAFLPPSIVGMSWVRYTDLVKERNLLGKALTSKALIGWNFGALEQRLDYTHS